MPSFFSYNLTHISERPSRVTDADDVGPATVADVTGDVEPSSRSCRSPRAPLKMVISSRFCPPPRAPWDQRVQPSAPCAAENLEVKPVLPSAPCSVEGEFNPLVPSAPRAIEDGEDKPVEPSALCATEAGEARH